MTKKVTHCRICTSKDLTPFLPLGNIALPNGFLKNEDLKEQEPLFPLTVGLCQTCGLVQLMDIVDPEVMFRNYVYIPSASQTRMDNFSKIAEQANDTISLDKTSLVIDIGSNDGSLLTYFKGYGIQTLGIDPASNLAKIAELKGIKTINDFISVPLSRKIVKKYGRAQVVCATNVVAHIDDLHGLLDSVKVLISKSGVFICEFPYLVDLLQKKLFDTIYHEHLSYFSVRPFLHLINAHDLKLVDIKRTAIDGGALRLTIASQKSSLPQNTANLNELMQLEDKLKLNQPETYIKFAKSVKQLKKVIKKTIDQFKKQKLSIAGYGASARGNILLSYCGLGRDEVNFIVDSTPYKQGLYTPGHHIPIYPEDALLKIQPDYTLILAWNFVNEIISKQKEYSKRGGRFIVPVPQIKIVKPPTREKKKPKVVVVMPAHNAEKTLAASYKKLPYNLITEVILVDDASTDQTVKVAKSLGITTYKNSINLGYGGNLKVCLTKALEKNADIVIEYHPDDQYDPKDLHLLIEKAQAGYDFALGSRFITPKNALSNKMPMHKFVANRALTFIDQLVLGIEMSELHSGFRMYTRKLLESVPFHQNSDDYLFSFEIIVQAVYWNFRIADVPVSCRYHPAMHTANLRRSAIYALGTIKTLWQYILAKFFRFQRGPFLLIQPAPCPFCEQHLTKFEYVVKDATSGENFSIFFCTLCQIGFTVPVPRNMSKYYPPTYYSKIKTIIYHTLQYRRPNIIQATIGKGNILDIGCGDGAIYNQLSKYKYKYTGIETPFSKTNNLLVKNVGVEGMKEKPSNYNLVTFWESFEHLKNPIKALQKSHLALKKNGYLIIECPNYSSWERYLFGARWFHLDPPRHLFHYTPRGLKQLLQDKGFQPITAKLLYAPEYTPVGLAQSVLYRISPRFNIFAKKKNIIVKFSLPIVLVLLATIFLPVSYLFYLLNGSPIQLIIAKKK